MSRLAPDAVAGLLDALPGRDAARWRDDERLRARLAANLATGMTRESWKYTPIDGFTEALAACTGANRPALEGDAQAGVRARPLEALSAPEQDALRQALLDGRLEADRHPLADLVLLRAASGWLIEIEGEIAEPLHLRYPAGTVAPVLLRLAPQATVTVVEHRDGGAFEAQLMHAEVGPGARLTHYCAPLAADIGHWSLLQVNVARDAHFELNQTCVGGKRRRCEVHVILEGRGASTDLSGAYLVEHGRHLDQQLLVEHRAADTTSRQKFHGIGVGRGRSVFNGRIHIHANSPRSDATLANKNLALHPDAEMNTKPELEIYTDDVRCAHGATVGQLAVDSLFYLAARGVPDLQARRLLSYGFVRECMAGPLADGAADRFMAALR